MVLKMSGAIFVYSRSYEFGMGGKEGKTTTIWAQAKKRERGNPK